MANVYRQWKYCAYCSSACVDYKPLPTSNLQFNDVQWTFGEYHGTDPSSPATKWSRNNRFSGEHRTIYSSPAWRLYEVEIWIHEKDFKILGMIPLEFMHIHLSLWLFVIVGFHVIQPLAAVTVNEIQLLVHIVLPHVWTTNPSQLPICSSMTCSVPSESTTVLTLHLLLQSGRETINFLKNI